MSRFEVIIQVIKVLIMTIVGLGMVYVASSILAKLDKIIYLLFVIGQNTQR